MIPDHFGLRTSPILALIPEKINDHSYWQYGTGNHASGLCKILGSVVISAGTDSEKTIRINHILPDVSSQCFSKLM